MKKILSIFLILFSFLAGAQDVIPLPSITMKKLIAPNNPLFYFNTADSALWVFKGETGWLRIATHQQLLRYYVPYDGANRNVDLNLKTIRTAATKYVNNIVNPTYLEGETFYDKNKHAVSYYNEEADITVNLGREILIRVYNGSGATILNGRVVYPTGDINGVPSIALADAGYYDKCRIIAVVTHDIENNSFGYVTKFGEVGGLNTSGRVSSELFYLDHDGLTTNVFPSHDDFICIIGSVGVVDATEGTIMVDTKVSDYSRDVNLVRGWDTSLQGDEVTVSFDDATRTLSVIPTGATFHIYEDGMKYVLTGTKTITITDVEGKHFVYFNKNQITEAVNPTPEQAGLIFRTNSAVSVIYWDAINDKQLMLGNERHSIHMQGAVQGYLHQTQWTKCIPSGFTPLNLVTDNGSLNIYAQFGVDSGIIIDEDIQSSTPVIASTVGLPIYYRSGTGVWRRTTRAGYSVLNDGVTGLVQYNKLTAGVWSLASHTNVYYGLIHVYGTNDLGSNKIVALMGTGDYASKLDADTGIKAELLSIKSQFPFAEGKHLYSILYSTKGSYANVPKMNIEINYLGGMFYDYRDVTETPASGASAASTSFLALTDTPDSYAGQANKIVGVTSGELGVEFKAATVTAAGTINIPDGQSYNKGGVPIISQVLNGATTTLTASQKAIKDYADTKDPSITNELNTSVFFNPTTKELSVVDAGGTKTTTINVSTSQDVPFSQSYIGEDNVITSNVSVTYPTAFTNNNYALMFRAWYIETIGGKSVQISNPVYNFTKLASGFSFSADTVAGKYSYFAADTTVVLNSSGFKSKITNEIPNGIVSGSNIAFTLDSVPTINTEQIYINGLRQTPIVDYSIINNNISFVSAPKLNYLLLADYSIGTLILNEHYNEIPSGYINGINTIFVLLNSVSGTDISLFLNGARQRIGIDFTLSGNMITFMVAPLYGYTLLADYKN